MRTQVAIVGAGPAGLLLSHLLHARGIETVVLEARSREAVEATIRAGVLEHGTVQILRNAGVGDRMQREGSVHRGIVLRFQESDHRIDLSVLTGRTIMLYAQHEVIKDLVEARSEAGGAVVFEADDVALLDFDSTSPRVRYRHDGKMYQLSCDFIAGCDGFHGVCRPSVPKGILTEYSHLYPFAWFGILVESPRLSSEIVYCAHESGFALISTRSPTLQRLYFQCDPQEDADKWTEARIWDELQARLHIPGEAPLLRGPITQKGVIAMRSFVVEPMQYGRLYLAGDAAHIVPPTGAKGLNLAVADVCVLAQGLGEFYATGSKSLLDGYSDTCLPRAWSAQRFSWWMTSLLHRFPQEDAFQYRLRLAELAHVTRSRSAATFLAENYVGLSSSELDAG